MISRNGFYFYLGLVAVVLGFCLRGERWLPLVDSANLAFHEFGHPFFGAFSARLMVYGGTLGQLVFPVVVSIQFFRQGEIFSFAVGLLWLAENFLNIARYMADARAHELPLVGGGEHDWTEIFSRWGVLESDVQISKNLVKLVVLGLLALTIWLYSRTEKKED